MLGRKNENLEEMTLLSKEIITPIVEILEETYEREPQLKDKTFAVHGLRFQDEFCLILGIVSKENPLQESPFTISLSIDRAESSSEKKNIDELINILGLLIDQYLNTETKSDLYCPVWTQEKSNSLDFYYKIGREDVSATLMAEQLLLKNSK